MNRSRIAQTKNLDFRGFEASRFPLNESDSPKVWTQRCLVLWILIVCGLAGSRVVPVNAIGTLRGDYLRDDKGDQENMSRD